jgi:hypothetical protein
MIVCPVCEHAQAQGTECEVCGRRLARGPSAADLAVPPVLDLEPTSHAPIDAPEQRLPELEATRHAAAAAVAGEPVPGIEATRTAPVDVDAEPVPDVERTSAPIPGDSPTAIPAITVCRYCRTPAAPDERICGRCGMRLPVIVVAGEGEGEPPPRVCTCGTPVRGALCPSCGARMPS